MRKLSILLVLVLLGSLVALPAPTKAESSSSYWVKSYGGSQDDEAYAVALAPNGDIIVAGYYNEHYEDVDNDGYEELVGDLWVLRLDANGNVKWQKTYGGSYYDYARAVAIAENGDIIVAGKYGEHWTCDNSRVCTLTSSPGVWVLRLDENGNVKWQKSYGGSNWDEATAVAIAPNGDVIIAGYTESFGAGGRNAWVLRLDAQGNVKWQKTYGGRWDDEANAVAVAENGDIIVAGDTYSFGAGGYDVWVLRLDENGNVKWGKTYGGSDEDWANAVAIAPNGDVIVAGWTGSFGAGGYDFWVLRLDENGNVKWQKTHGGDYNEGANAVAIAPNGDIIVAGRDLLRLSPDGELKWAVKLGGNDIKVLPDGTAVLAGEYQDNLLVARFNVDEVLDYFGWWGWEEKSLEVSNSYAQVESTNAEVKESDAEIQDTNTVITYTNAQVKTLWGTGTLEVTSDPSGAKVYIDGDYKGETPLTLELSQGTHTVKLTKEDYEDYTKTIEIKPGETTTLSATLTPKFGYLTVYSSPSGAEVYLDGDYVGTTPLENYKLSTGEHEVKVKKSGYATFTKTITIKPCETTSMKATLTPLKATLKITSEPSGAKVYVNGTYKGVTPLTLNLTPGTYTIKLSKEDYEDYTMTVTLSAEETKTISATLEPAYGFLSVDSTPSDAEIYVDGSYVGTTPLEDYKLSPGEHKVTIKKEGYEEYTKTVTITAGEKKTLSTSLVPLPPPTTGSTTTTTTTTTTSSTTTTPPASSSETPSPAQTSSLPYIAGALIGLLLIGGVAAKAKGGKPKPSPSPEASPTPEKTGIKTQSKHVPGFPPELLSKYEPLEFLGEGGFAKVFKVKRKSDGRIIALKVSRLDEKAKKFFLKEIKAWRLLDHPNIVKLYNAFDEPLPHLEIEFVDGIQLDGETIRDLGKYPKPVDEEKALHFIKGIAKGLKHAHSKQVYHRDLKPQNVLITSDLTPKITDWGLAKVGAVSTTATTTKGLTLLYAAPEQLDDETYGHTDQRTDIYQLGLIFYELLTGKPPYIGSSPAVVMAKVINPDVKPKPPSHFNKSLAKYDGIFEKLLAKRKEQRYQSIEEFLKDLELMKKLDEERKALEKEIEKTKTTMSMTTDSKELKKLMRQLVEQLSRNALLHAQLNDKAGLINALEDLKAFSKKHRKEIENAIAQFELMMRESIPISKSTLDELRVLLHKVQREVE